MPGEDGCAPRDAAASSAAAQNADLMADGVRMAPKTARGRARFKPPDKRGSGGRPGAARSYFAVPNRFVSG